MNIQHKRQGQMELQTLYFYTQTLAGFRHLLKDDNIKQILLQSLQFLVKNHLITVYGYVIMPNHIHLIHTLLRMNGKENPALSFTNFTSHQIKKYLLLNDPELLSNYQVNTYDRS